MTLPIGSRLGPYEIQSLLGAGGMGEVYRARDTRLNRTVAIKILPPDRCASPEARQRFEREAATISQLAHPHICALYDVGSQASADGAVDYLVMEHLEGQTLAERLEKGALPLDQALRSAIQIADALHKAHRQGVVHRDLKPANVMLTRTGVKLLDFGLAKSGAPVAQPGSLTALPTRADLTQEGTILGTIPYMAPEQLEGKEADPRTDIFALGAVLYEMATGRRAFAGTSQASLISAIMKEHPAPMGQAQPTTPPALDHVVRTCLAKDPDERWQSAGDVRNQLAWIAEGGGQAPAAAGATGRRPGRERIAWGVAALAILVAAGAYLINWRPAPQAGPGPRRFSILLPDLSAVRAAVLSPDGSHIAVVARDAQGKNLLWIRALDTLAPQPLPGTENPSFPFWSPDGRFIGFFADGKLKKIAATGGPPQTLCDAPVSRGGTWGADGTILLAPNPNTPLYRVAASGGEPTAVTRFDPERGETSHRWPFFLPDGRHFLYLVASFAGTTQQERHGIYVASLDGGQDRFLVRAKSTLAYAPPGYVLFLRERNLFAQSFDAQTLQLAGDPFPVAERIQFFPQIYGALFSASASGSLLYQDETTTSVSQLVWFDRGGHRLGAVGEPGDQANPRLSPDGKRVTADITDPRTGNIDIWVRESAGGIATRLTSHPAIDGAAVWSPDGKEIVFTSVRSGNNDLYRMGVAGGGEQPLMLSERLKYPTDWSPDGRFILFRVLDAQSNPELWIAPSRGDGKPTPFIKTSFGVTNGQFSPDGRYMAYASNESGRWEIYVAPFPGPGGNWRVSSAGGSEPKWRRDGRELYYIAPDGTLMAVAVREAASFDADAPRALFAIRRREPVSSLDLFSYDVAPDGQRFLVNTDVGDTTTTPLTIVLDWASGTGK